MITHATLIGIASHRQSRGEIVEHEQAFLDIKHGLKDYRGLKDPLTSVTVLSYRSWNEACQEVNAQIDWTERRAQLLIDDLMFSPAAIGRELKVGNAVLRITRETDPCGRMDELHPGLKNALTPDWRGGARCEVIQSGTIRVGDSVEWICHGED